MICHICIRLQLIVSSTNKDLIIMMNFSIVVLGWGGGSVQSAITGKEVRKLMMYRILV